jgi:hypothetical protein
MREDRSGLLNWAAQLEQTELQAGAMHWIAERWASSDPAGFRQWLPSLAPGSARDAALNSFIRACAGAGVFESELLGSFSSGAAADAGASNALLELARREPAAAERLANSMLTDATVRERTLQRIGQLW